MKRNKLQNFYIISVLIILGTFSTSSYNIGRPSFFVPVIIVALVFGAIGVYLFGKDLKLYKNLHFLSYVLTIGVAFVPVLGVYIEEGRRSYGFPAQWFTYYNFSGSVSLHLLGFLFNYLLVYFFLRTLKKVLLSFTLKIDLSK